LLLYETQKGGAGTVAKVHAKWERLLADAVQLMEECPCEAGCPNCIVIAGCGEYNHGLDKAAAIRIGRALGLGKPGHFALPGSAPTEAAAAIADADTTGAASIAAGSSHTNGAPPSAVEIKEEKLLEDIEDMQAQAPASASSAVEPNLQPDVPGSASATEPADGCLGHCRVAACARPRAFKRRLNASRPPENHDASSSAADIKCFDLD